MKEREIIIEATIQSLFARQDAITDMGGQNKPN